MKSKEVRLFPLSSHVPRPTSLSLLSSLTDDVLFSAGLVTPYQRGEGVCKLGNGSVAV